MSHPAPGPDNRADRGAEGGGAAGGGAQVVVASPARPAARVAAALAGFREPVVWVLLAIAFFTSISGKPVDGVLMLIVAMGLAWDAGRRALRHPEAGDPPARARVPAGGRRRVLTVAALLAGGVAYAAVMGSFSRYSWPATAGIIGLGTVVVLIGWHGPLRSRPTGGRPPLAGTVAWIVVLVAGCLWELAALLQQPSITSDSYAHPTISTLTDPLLATSPGRSLVLFAWLALGWYLVER